VLVVSWNIHAIVGAGEDRRRAIVARLAEREPDIVLLQAATPITLSTGSRTRR